MIVDQEQSVFFFMYKARQVTFYFKLINYTVNCRENKRIYIIKKNAIYITLLKISREILYR